MTLGQKWNEFWSARFPANGLAVYRVLLCLLILHHLKGTEMVGLVRMDQAEDYFAGGFYTPYFSWLTPPSYGVFLLLGRACFLLTCAALLGFLTRFSFLAVWGIFLYLFLLNKHFYYNHLYTIVLASFLAGFAPLGETWSVDSLIARFRGREPSKICISWSLRMMQVLVSILYFSTAAAKTTRAWLSGDLMRLFSEFGKVASQDGSYAPPSWLGFLHTVLFWVQAAASLSVEYFLVFALWPKKLRPWALSIGVIFHLYLEITMRISSFTWQMFLFYFLFAISDREEREMSRLSS